jgi:hypothetical protein
MIEAEQKKAGFIVRLLLFIRDAVNPAQQAQRCCSYYWISISIGIVDHYNKSRLFPTSLLTHSFYYLL